MPGIEYFLNEPIYEYIKNELERIEERIRESEIVNTVSGNIASFPDGADDVPMKSVIAHIEPVQSGTGDPSPSNIRPITGWSGANVHHQKKNLFLANASGGSSSNISFVRNEDGSLTFSGQANGTIRTPTLGNVLLPPGTYIANGVTDGSENTYGLRVTKIVGGSTEILETFYTGEYTFTLEETATIRFTGRFSSVQTAPYNVTLYPMIRPANITDGTYEPYNDTVYMVDWQTEAGTVYGGNDDVISGKLTVTDANIASYNGETLPSTWISDRDVYAEGTTPTIGAQVVYKLAVPIEYDLTPQEIKSLLGANNIYADTGNTDVTYVADTKLYIDSRL